MKSGYLKHVMINEIIRHRIDKAFELLRNLDINNYKDGRYEIDKDMFFLVQRYETKPESEALYEAHRKYIDIQYIVKGSEIIDVAALEDAEEIEDFDLERDIGFYKCLRDYTRIRLGQGQYGLFMPNDCHKPSFHEGGTKPSKVEKIVMKVKFEEE